MTETTKWHRADDGCVCCCTDEEHDGWKHPDEIAMLNGLEADLAAVKAAAIRDRALAALVLRAGNSLGISGHVDSDWWRDFDAIVGLDNAK